MINSKGMGRRSQILVSILRNTCRKMTATELAEVMGIEPHYVRAAVNRLRKRGYDIQNEGRGYWLASTTRS